MPDSRLLGESVCQLLGAFGRSTSIALVTLGVLGVLAWRSPDSSQDLGLASLVVAFGGFCLLLRGGICEMVNLALWVLSVVVTGLLLNLLTPYLQKPFDKMMSATWSIWANRSAAAKQARDARIERLSHDAHARVQAGFRAIWNLGQALVLVSGAGVLFILTVVFQQFASLLPGGTPEKTDPMAVLSALVAFAAMLLGFAAHAYAGSVWSELTESLRSLERRNEAPAQEPG